MTTAATTAAGAPGAGRAGAGMAGASPAGRPLRALALLALVVALWIVLRLPTLQHDAAATAAVLAQVQAPAPQMAQQAAPQSLPQNLPQAGPGQQPAATVTLAAAGTPSLRTGADRRVAEAELALALANRDVALAQLALARADRDGVPAAPAAPTLARLATAGTLADAAPAAAAQRARTSRRPAPAAALATTAPVATAATAATAAPAGPPPPGSPQLSAQDLATAAYARLAEGDRRGAVRLFDAALAAPVGTVPNERRDAWAAERRRLARRWSATVYSLLRADGASGPAASPVLGGGQSGASLAWSPDPLARRPVALVARINAASGNNSSIDGNSAQAAFGVRWQPVRWASISAERLVAVGANARNDWTLRLAGGADGQYRRIGWSGYGEAGVIANGDVYAGAQGRVGVPVLTRPKATLAAGVGAWGSIQTGAITTDRFDLGPTLTTVVPIGRTRVAVAADWRFRVAGNAQPGSGPALTISTGF